MGLSEFEKQRQANIERNKRLLSSLNLSSITGEISNGIKKELLTKAASSASSGPKKKKVKTESSELKSIPTRRSRRIAGVALDDEDRSKQFELEEDKRNREREELEKLKTIRINGDLSLLDLVRDGSKSSVKEEDEGELLGKFQKFLNNSKSFSVGDYYEQIVKKEKNTDKDVQKSREEFSEMSLYEHFAPNEIKLTSARMTYIQFHPTVDKKLILGADHEGLLGVWNADDTEELDITQFKLHGKSIAKLEFDLNDLSKVYTASYDGSIRCVDLGTMKSTQTFINGYDIGITDINLTNGHEMYYTTMDGEFGRVDIRSSDHSQRQAFRLSNKKIGGFSINPNDSNQVVTASLDRTMKIFDLRKVEQCTWSAYEHETLDTFNIPGVYDSRLSVSIADWNHSNDIVCNGYDDTVNVFQLGLSNNHKKNKIPSALTPTHTIKHNCQTGRWVSILKARWHKYPQDQMEKFVIGNMKKYFDVYDRNGNQLAHLSDPLVTNVPAVANFHHTKNWVVGGGASGKVYLFT